MKKLCVLAVIAALALGIQPQSQAASNRSRSATPPSQSVLISLDHLASSTQRSISAQAYGDPFDSVQFNICSLNCSDGTIPDDAAFTNFGLNPVSELLDEIEVRGWPRIISLNEVCGQAAWAMAASLPAGLYDASFYVAARRPEDCALFGNWVAVRTGDVPATEASEVHLVWDGGTPPPEDHDSEHRGAACLRSFIFLEQIWGCAVHIDDDPAKANGLLAFVNSNFGTSAQAMLGDFNLVPGSGAMVNWDNSNRDDLFDDIVVTYKSGSNHIDYGWVELTALNDDPLLLDSLVILSSSDHYQLWGVAEFK